MRAFIAINLPDDVKAKISEVITSIPGNVIKVSNKNLHITLQYLGNINAEQEAAAKAILSSIKIKKFNAEIRGISYFGAHKIHTVYARVNDPVIIPSIYRNISEKLKLHGIIIENEREYIPHVTLCRVKGGNNKDLRAYINEHSDFFFGKILVSSLSLERSDLSLSGPVYSTIYECDFL
jgi:2'-5' RNA ligase